ncbi:stearoyl-CoA desaturase 5 [Enhydra lutris kenyoni]|uniref:Stearoyl-CoA desaturase 5 n=1 Tax=Enhydra lutris kenyoni TaxID=391180 RepID=A0A2Y9JQK3_ENHLU|nr:stearoyl-CoA desaturase 5 [Enhydra lutris kenyoni]
MSVFVPPGRPTGSTPCSPQTLRTLAPHQELLRQGLLSRTAASHGGHAARARSLRACGLLPGSSISAALRSSALPVLPSPCRARPPPRGTSRTAAPRAGPAGGGGRGAGRARRVVWRNVAPPGPLHAAALSSLALVPAARPLTLLWAYFCFLLNALGVTASAHRLRSHRSHKAQLPLRIFLAAAYSMASQNDIFEWARDHRVHHRYSETDVDPHNAHRGCCFSHIRWLFVRKHRNVIEKGRKLDLTDLLADPVVRYQRKYYKITVVLMCFAVPTTVPWCFWGESLWNSYCLASILRYTISLNVTWLVNSAAHMYGNRPYDKHISPWQNLLVTLGTIGEGFHSYHHTFPLDYSASEFGLHFNSTTWFIDLMCWLGLAPDRKRATKPMIEARKARTGDGSL